MKCNEYNLLRKIGFIMYKNMVLASRIVKESKDHFFLLKITTFKL